MGAPSEPMSSHRCSPRIQTSKVSSWFSVHVTPHSALQPGADPPSLQLVDPGNRKFLLRRVSGSCHPTTDALTKMLLVFEPFTSPTQMVLLDSNRSRRRGLEHFAPVSPAQSDLHLPQVWVRCEMQLSGPSRRRVCFMTYK